jgi:hypothetical protein
LTEWLMLLLLVPPLFSEFRLLKSGTTATKFTAAFRKLGDPKIWDGEYGSCDCSGMIVVAGSCCGRAQQSAARAALFLRTSREVS